MNDDIGGKLNSQLARIQLKDEESAAYTQLYAFLSQYEVDTQGQLPPERELCDILGVSRGALRKALARAEAQGRIWRHVGKGTFIGSRPIEDTSDLSGISNLASPRRFCARAACSSPPLLGKRRCTPRSWTLRNSK